MELRTQDNRGYKKIMNLIPRDSTILDLGCGCGNPFRGIKFPLLVGVDVFRKRFDMPEYDVVMFYDVNKIDELFLDKSFDIVTGIDFIEHLKKEEGFEIIKKAEKIARKKVIFFTPKKWDDNKQAVEDSKYWSYGNTYNYHHSLWCEEDFIQRGYEIVPFNLRYVLAQKEIK